MVNGQEFRSLFLVNEIVTTYFGIAIEQQRALSEENNLNINSDKVSKYLESLQS